MLFKILAFVKRWSHRTERFVERRLSSETDREEWNRIHQEREAIERRLSYLETQADVYARKDL